MSIQATARGRLAAAIVAGEPLDLLGEHKRRDGELLDESVMLDWDDGHDITAKDLLALIRGRDLPGGGAANPRGVEARGIRIRDRLNLDFVTDAMPLVLVDCLLAGGISAFAAHLPYLELRRCRITHPTDIPLALSGIRVDDDIDISGSAVKASRGAGTAMTVAEAHIGHSLRCSGTTISNDFGSALSADRCQISGDVYFSEDFHAQGAGPDPTVEISATRIGGSVFARGARLINYSGAALAADRCEISGDAEFSFGFEARGAGTSGAVRLVDARVAGHLSLIDAYLLNQTGSALIGDGCEIGRGYHSLANSAPKASVITLR